MTLEVFRHQYMNYFTSVKKASVKKDTFFEPNEMEVKHGYTYNSMINQLVSINYRWYDPILSILAHPPTSAKK